MPTFKSEFTDLANELFIEFADFLISCKFTLKGGYDPVADTYSSSTSETILCIREDFEAREFDGRKIQVSDFKLLAQNADFSVLSPRTDGIIVTIDASEYTVVSASKDPANAVWTIQVRG